MKRFRGAHNPENRFRKYLGPLQVVVVVLLYALLISVSAEYENVRTGQGILLGLGILAAIVRIPSLTIFKIALGMLVLVPVLSVVLPESDASDAFSVYAFVTLCIGIVLALFEAMREKLHRRYVASVKKATDSYLRDR